MKCTRYALMVGTEFPEFLTEDGSTTVDPYKAIAFVDIDVASSKLVIASGIVSEAVTIKAIEVDFPRPLFKQ